MVNFHSKTQPVNHDYTNSEVAQNRKGLEKYSYPPMDLFNKLSYAPEELCQFFYTFKRMYKLINQYYKARRDGGLHAVQELSWKNPESIHSSDPRGPSPFMLAAYYNQFEIASFLLKNGAADDEKDASGNTALMGVCYEDYDALAKLLIESGANVNAIGASCLIFAASFNREYIVKPFWRTKTR